MKTWPCFFLFSVTFCVCIITIPVVHSKCIPDQQQSLLHFKSSLLFNASVSSKLIYWNSSTDCCSWAGVTCSDDGRVLGIDISSESISGDIDNSISLLQLQHLQSLNMADNKLGNNSSIPSAVGQLMRLRYLNLSDNPYLGKIPNLVKSISPLTRLVVLDISQKVNYLDRELNLEIRNLHMLVENLTKLEELYLDYVQISAEGSKWCQAISSSLPNLRVLSLSHCNLSGPFHDSLSKLQSLSVIQLDSTNISAPVPTFFANFSNLTSLSLAFCNLQGTFPKEIFQLPSLRKISLSGNENLHGSLPEFPKNGSLQELDLGETNFSGVLPNSIGNLKMLSIIYIGYCSFTGSIPKSMANLTQLVALEMYENKFEGSIPSFSGAKNLYGIDMSSNYLLAGNLYSTHWDNLTKIQYLYLEHNMLDGNIPSALFSLSLLNTLHLFNNQFFGHFPEISNLSTYSVKDLDLSTNNLEGPIPMSIFNFRGLTSLYLDSNNFSGLFPLDGLQHLRNLSVLDLSYNSLLLSLDTTNFSNPYFPQFVMIRLASGKLRAFPSFLRNQYVLETLDLSDNQIHGMIPDWIWRFRGLTYLNLSCNSLETLEGTINLTSLEILDLHSNQLQGKIPISSAPNMFFLDYSRNNFSSTIPASIEKILLYTSIFYLSSNNLQGIIPGSICNSYSLEVLDMSNNSLSGTVPHCLITMSSLSVLNLRRNNLRNVDILSHNCSLRTLDISENQIHGQFLKSLIKCPHLKILNLGNNQITRPFPCFLNNISTLRVLILRSNKFYGGIGCPNTNGTWRMLQIIDLADNNLSGNVPGRDLTTWQAMMTDEDGLPSKLNHLPFQDSRTAGYYQDSITVTIKGQEMEIVRSLSIFTSVDLSCNNFTGSIPEEIGDLKALVVLNLSTNAFTGAIPPSLSNLRQLESLDLSQNTLSGQIPPQLTELTFLSVLNLSHNQLVGRIPNSNQFPTFPDSSFEGNKDLFRPPLTEDNTTRLSPPASKKSSPNFGDEIDWDIISVEIGFTCGFGVAIGSLFFCERWRKWYYRAMYSILVKIFPQLEQRFGHHRRHVYIGQRYWRR